MIEKRAAEADDACSNYNLGCIYSNGELDHEKTLTLQMPPAELKVPVVQAVSVDTEQEPPTSVQVPQVSPPTPKVQVDPTPRKTPFLAMQSLMNVVPKRLTRSQVPSGKVQAPHPPVMLHERIVHREGEVQEKK